MNQDDLNNINMMGHKFVDEIQNMGHEFINTAIQLSAPILNNLNIPNANANANANAKQSSKTKGNINYYISNQENKILICCELPGVSKNNCKINYANNILNITGETDFKNAWGFIENKQYHREIDIGIVDNKDIKAEYIDGLLNITIFKMNDDNQSNIEIN